MTKKSFLAIMLAIALAKGAVAQTQNLSGFKSLSYNSINPIFEGKEVKGYTLFYKSDKADRKNDNYHIKIFDENLAQIKTIDLVKPNSGFTYIGNAYTGSDLGFCFYNYKEDRYELEAYDKALNKTGEVKVPHKLSQYEEYILQQRNTNEQGTDQGLGLYAVPNKGFILTGITGRGKGYTFEMFDKQMKSKWSFATDEKSDDYESPVINEINDKYLICTVVKRPGLLSKKMNYFVTVFDVNTGKKSFELPIESDINEQLSLTALSYDEKANQFLLVGDYYKPKDKPGVSKSQGFYIKMVDDKGKVINKKFYSWENDLKGKLPAEAAESINKGSMNFTHKVLKANDGKIHLICEQYSTAFNVFGLSNSSNESMVKAQVWNMIVYSINPDFSINTIKLYSKDKTNVSLPSGALYYGAGLIGYMTKLMGGFDYQFTQATNNGKDFNVVYVDYDKEKGQDSKLVIGNIIISSDKYNLDKIDITKAATPYLYPAKKGNVMMIDYLRKEKTAGMKLIKLNF